MQVGLIVEGQFPPHGLAPAGTKVGCLAAQLALIVEKRPAMNTQTDKIEELLKLGWGLGPGSRYLIRYEGELTITNSSGLANWPGPRPEILAKLDAIDCL